MNVDVDLQNGGTITYANEVIAIIAGVAANEIDGIAGMCMSGGFGDILGKNRNITRGVKVEIGTEEASVDLYAIVEYGKPIQKVASEVQENVRKAIESMTGLHVVRVDVHVQGVSFEKEKKAAQKGIEAAQTPVLAASGAPVLSESKNEPEAAAAAAQTFAPAAQETPAQDAPAADEADETADEAADDPAPEQEFDQDALAEEAALDGADKCDCAADGECDCASGECDCAAQAGQSAPADEQEAAAEPAPEEKRKPRKRS